MLGRFQNSSVPVLNLSTHSVPVSTGFVKSINFESGFEGFGFSVLTVLNFGPISAQFLIKLGISYVKFRFYFSVKSNMYQNHGILTDSNQFFD